MYKARLVEIQPKSSSHLSVLRITPYFGGSHSHRDLFLSSEFCPYHELEVKNENGYLFARIRVEQCRWSILGTAAALLCVCCSHPSRWPSGQRLLVLARNSQGIHSYIANSRLCRCRVCANTWPIHSNAFQGISSSPRQPTRMLSMEYFLRQNDCHPDRNPCRIFFPYPKPS